MGLKDIIPAEIHDDELANEITKLVKMLRPATMLEIGSSSGEGSTQAFIRGMQERGADTGMLYCIEASRPRFERLKKNVAHMGDAVKPYHVTSVRDDEAMSDGEVRRFFGLLTGLVKLPVLDIGEDRIISWHEDELNNVAEMDTPRDGIRQIMAENDIDIFDMVLIDGSPFTALAELALVHGAKIIVLDDIMAFKTFEVHQRMKRDREYRMYKTNETLRNGYSIWIKK